MERLGDFVGGGEALRETERVIERDGDPVGGGDADDDGDTVRERLVVRDSDGDAVGGGEKERLLLIVRDDDGVSPSELDSLTSSERLGPVRERDGDTDDVRERLKDFVGGGVSDRESVSGSDGVSERVPTDTDIDAEVNDGVAERVGGSVNEAV